MQPDRTARGNKFERVLQKIRDDALQLGRIEGKNRQLIVGQKIKRQTFFLKTGGPETADIRQAVVDIRRLVAHLEAAGFERAVSQKILDKLLQPFPAGLHIAQHFALPFV